MKLKKDLNAVNLNKLTGSYDERSLRRGEVTRRENDMYAREKLSEALNYARFNDFNGEFYQGIDPRRKQEVGDAGQIKEDRRAMANLSNEPVHRKWEEAGFWTTPYNDDLLSEEGS